MADDYFLKIKKIDHSKRFGQQKNPKQKKNEKKQGKTKDEAVKYFEELSHSAERVNSILERKKSSYRFCIYKEKKDVYIDLVLLDKNRKVRETRRKKITHQEFSKIIETIEKLDGFIVDCEV